MRKLALILPLAMLAGCDSSPEVDARNASVEEVAEQVRESGVDGQWVRPGLWSTTVTLAEVDMPGMPAEVRDRMRETMRAQSHEACLTEAEAKKPSEDFFAGANRNCRYDHFRMDDGKLDARMSCQAEGMTQQMEMSGTYRPDSYTVSMTTRAEGPATAGMGAMTMKMNVESKRVGDCPEGQATAG